MKCGAGTGACLATSGLSSRGCPTVIREAGPLPTCSQAFPDGNWTLVQANVWMASRKPKIACLVSQFTHRSRIIWLKHSWFYHLPVQDSRLTWVQVSSFQFLAMWPWANYLDLSRPHSLFSFAWLHFWEQVSGTPNSDKIMDRSSSHSTQPPSLWRGMFILLRTPR